ncbi:MAG: hypothetical protein JWM91_4006 [Rhodospirillales bacterium]|nr:hypothetical protein [Rhodospirillales bacterium]
MCARFGGCLRHARCREIGRTAADNLLTVPTPVASRLLLGSVPIRSARSDVLVQQIDVAVRLPA